MTCTSSDTRGIRNQYIQCLELSKSLKCHFPLLCLSAAAYSNRTNTETGFVSEHCVLKIWSKCFRWPVKKFQIIINCKKSRQTMSSVQLEIVQSLTIHQSMSQKVFITVLFSGKEVRLGSNISVVEKITLKISIFSQNFGC